jgi:Rrf2 family protein
MYWILKIGDTHRGLNKRVFYLLFGLLLYLYNNRKKMFSRTCEYAMRAMIFIAQNSKQGNKIGVKTVAAGIDSPEHFIAKILQDLSKKGLLQSNKGPNGGFYLETESLNCSLADIVRAVDGDKFFTGCGLGLKQCSENSPCPLHNEFKKIREDTLSMLENARLDTLVNQIDIHPIILRRN